MAEDEKKDIKSVVLKVLKHFATENYARSLDIVNFFV